MKRLAPVILSITIFSLSIASASASTGTRSRTHSHGRLAIETFRLRISAKPSPGTTFWVAYGPLAGHFGIVQLHPQGSQTYAATFQLPGPGRTEFTYLASQGVSHTRLGAVPGGPTATIAQFGPLAVPQQSVPEAKWQTPIG